MIEENTFNMQFAMLSQDITIPRADARALHMTHIEQNKLTISKEQFKMLAAKEQKFLSRNVNPYFALTDK